MTINKTNFAELIKKINSYPGVAAKKPIGSIVSALGGLNKANGMGDDCGYLPAEDGFLLFTADSISERLFEDPWFAGFCGINVVVNDIFAMGGKPLGLVDTVYATATDQQWLEALVRGMKDACAKFGVPLLGGHLTADAPFRALSVSGMGRTSGAGSGSKNSSGSGFGVSNSNSGRSRSTDSGGILTTFGANSGDTVIAVYDFSGGPRGGFPVWDSSTAAEPSLLQQKLNLLPLVAEKGLATAARDISNAGIIGTLAMLTEASGVGATVNLEKIPRPRGRELESWLFIYPSYGFILTAPPACEAEVLELFSKNGLEASAIGFIRAEKGVTVKLEGAEETVFHSGIMGLNERR